MERKKERRRNASTLDDLQQPKSSQDTIETPPAVTLPESAMETPPRVRSALKERREAAETGLLQESGRVGLFVDASEEFSEAPSEALSTPEFRRKRSDEPTQMECSGRESSSPDERSFSVSDAETVQVNRPQKKAPEAMAAVLSGLQKTANGSCKPAAKSTPGAPDSQMMFDDFRTALSKPAGRPGYLRLSLPAVEARESPDGNEASTEGSELLMNEAAVNSVVCTDDPVCTLSNAGMHLCLTQGHRLASICLRPRLACAAPRNGGRATGIVRWAAKPSD